jgi:hypothetical protein
MDQPKKISQEPIATSIGENDRYVFLYNANTTSPSLRTITANNVMRTSFKGLPVYADNAAALANNEPVGSMYMVPNGFVKIVLAV